jgi:membrane protein
MKATSDALHGKVGAFEDGMTPRRDWKGILLRTLKSFNDDQIPTVAAGVTFFVLLAIFPALSAFVSLYGLFADASQAREQVEALSGLLPGGAITVVTDQIDRLVKTDHGSLGLAFIVSVLVSLWSANAGIKALFAGLNDAYGAKEHRNFFSLNALSLTFTAGMVIFAVLSLSALVAVPSTLARIGLGFLADFAFLRWPMILLVVGVLLSLLYRYGPCRPHAKWRWITLGEVIAAVVWLAMSLGFSWYVSNFGNFDKTYGSLGAIVGFMTWIWLSVMVVLFGGELNANLRPRQAARPPESPHPRRKAVAR